MTVQTWQGTRVVVTGASSGIGAALARTLAAAGADIVIVARRAELLDAVRSECEERGARCHAITCDLADLDAVDRFAAQALDVLGGVDVHIEGLGREPIDGVEVDRFAAQALDVLGGVDVLFNNAGGGTVRAALDTPWDELEYLDRLNYLSPVRLTRALLPSMLERGSGSVSTVSSMAARWSTPGEASYAAPKAALAAYFEALASELWYSGVSFHVVFPALIGLAPDVDGPDSLADSRNPSREIPAPVLARAMMRQVEQGAFELYMPSTQREQVAARAAAVESTVKFMADWYRDGGNH